MTEDNTPESLLPYERWTENALRAVVLDALEHAAREGLPGEHHFYISFRTDHPAVSIPAHLKARYPTEITIVLQHRFWDLKVDRAKPGFSVGLSFGGLPSQLVVPLEALTAFHDPHIRFGLRFEPEAFEPTPEPAPEPAPEPQAEPAPGEASAPTSQPQVVSLDAFRRKRD
jgi:hypothetical protein